MKYFAFLKVVDPACKSIVVLENINDQISDSDAWRGVNEENIASVRHTCGALFLDICGIHELSIINRPEQWHKQK